MVPPINSSLTGLAGLAGLAGLIFVFMANTLYVLCLFFCCVVVIL